MVLEVGVNVAARATSELCDWRSKAGRVHRRRRRGELVGNGAVAREVPDTDGAARPLHGINTTTTSVEVGTKVVGGDGLLGATSATVASAAVRRGEHLGAGKLGPLGHGAALVRVEGDFVGRLRVDTLDNVNLAGARPVWAKGPERRPCAASDGHVCHVGDEEHVGVGLVGGDACGGTSVGRVAGLVVGSQVDATLGVASQTRGRGLAGALVVHEAVGGISAGVEGEFVKKVGAGVAVLERVRGGCR